MVAKLLIHELWHIEQGGSEMGRELIKGSIKDYVIKKYIPKGISMRTRTGGEVQVGKIRTPFRKEVTGIKYRKTF